MTPVRVGSDFIWPQAICDLRVGLIEPDNDRVIPDAGDVETVGADIIAKLSAKTSEFSANAGWDQRIVMSRSRILANRLD